MGPGYEATRKHSVPIDCTIYGVPMLCPGIGCALATPLEHSKVTPMKAIEKCESTNRVLAIFFSTQQAHPQWPSLDKLVFLHDNVCKCTLFLYCFMFITSFL